MKEWILESKDSFVYEEIWNPWFEAGTDYKKDMQPRTLEEAVRYYVEDASFMDKGWIGASRLRNINTGEIIPCEGLFV